MHAYGYAIAALPRRLRGGTPRLFGHLEALLLFAKGKQSLPFIVSHMD